jgi:tRNA(adenine34) deaminase
MEIYTDEFFMREALKEAQKAFYEGEVPVGAVVVAQNKIIARGHNQTERLNDATAHAEMIAITSATSFIGGKYLTDCTLYVTLEPCVMCAGAMNWSQVSKVVYGADDVQRGFSLINTPLLHPKAEIVKGILAEECKSLIQIFFERLRN